jgi:hypothetical protein
VLILKGKVLEWSDIRVKNRDRLLKEVDTAIENLFNNNSKGVFSKWELSELARFEDKNMKFSHDREEDWRMKSRVMWLELDEENMNFFHQFPDHQKNVNTIWELFDDEGVEFKVLRS